MQNKDSSHVGIILRTWIFILIIGSTYSQQIFQSLMTFSQPGTQYSPIVPSAQLILTSIQSSFKACAVACNQNVLCRVFDYGVNQPQQCRLFEGDTDTLGSIGSSPSSSSMVGTINITPDLYAAYGQPCASSSCSRTRYLQCGSNLTCECTPHTYWDSSKGMCLPQSPVLGAACQYGMYMCRKDLNYTCLQFNQCGPLSILSGTTIISTGTTPFGNSTITVGLIYLITLIESSGETVIVADPVGHQVVNYVKTSSNKYNVSAVFKTWSGGNSLGNPFGVFVDEKNGNNLYVTDNSKNQVVLFPAMQSISPLPQIIAGGTCGSGLNNLCGPDGLKIDNASNLIVCDASNARIMLWAPNATAGVVIAGSSARGNDSQSLSTPTDVYIDQKNAWFYVADTNNHRIQRFSLYGSAPQNGTTVAGGNGRGSGSNQLYSPTAVWVSEKTGNIYIADQLNSRIQRWKPNATEGVTVAGSPQGLSGSNATMFSFPIGLVVNANETTLYVSDTGNGRVQKFQLL